jgi:hypothetical protein
MELNIARISNLTPEQISTVNRLMSRDARYAGELVNIIAGTSVLDGLVTGMEIRATLYTMAGSPRVTEVLNMVENGAS